MVLVWYWYGIGMVIGVVFVWYWYRYGIGANSIRMVFAQGGIGMILVLY